MAILHIGLGVVSIGLLAATVFTVRSCNHKTDGQKNDYLAYTVNEKPDAIVAVETEEQFRTHINTTDRYVIAKFEAPWCGACKHLKPHVKIAAARLADHYTFIAIDVDKLPEIAREYSITGVPTMAFFRNGAEVAGVERIVGTADIDSAEALVAKLQALLPITPTPETGV